MIRPVLRALSVLLASSLIFAGCGGGGGRSVPSLPPQGSQLAAPPANISGATSFVWGSKLLSQLAYVGPAKGGGLSLAVQVHMRDAAGLVKYAQDASNPASASYRHWLTPAQIASQYGASASDYQAVANYFASYGLRVGGWPQREILTVSGSTQQFGRAFGTTFGTYTYLGRQMIAPSGTPHFASTLPVDAVVGLLSSVKPSSFFIHGNNASFFGYSPQQIATGLDYSGAYSAGFTGAGIHVGIIGTGPILNASGSNPDTAAFAAAFKANLAPITQIAAVPQPASSANGQTGTIAVDPNPAGLAPPPPVTNPNCTDPNPNFSDFTICNPEDLEAQIDTQSVASLAPGSSVLFYLAFNPFEGCLNPTTEGFDNPTGASCPSGDTPLQSEGAAIADDSIQQAIADNAADAISISFGGPENVDVAIGYIAPSGSPPGPGQIEMASLAAEGVAVFASSGDDGAFECFDPNTGNPLGTACVVYPASDPNVVAVGGINLPLDQGGNLTGSITAWADNTTLGGDGTFGNNVGSGGGVSAVSAAPPWQSATLGVSSRELPDMSLDADPRTGPGIMANAAFGGSLFAIGGTSVAAPEAAAQWSLVLQACKASSTCNLGGPTGYRLGNPTPYLYAIYATSSFAAGPYKPTGFSPQLTYSQVFYDVTYGDNQAVPAPIPTPAPGGTPIVIPTPTGYNSGPGYDEVTGLGAPFTGHLIQAITGAKAP
jgi:subtilase family serine protease